MTALSTFAFSGYTLRPAGLSDLPMAREWTVKDPQHYTVDPAFWVDQKVGRDAYVMEDAGGPIFFFKVCRLDGRTVELHIQFAPLEEKIKVGRALVQGLQWLEQTLQQSGVQELLFESWYPDLIEFSTRRLGFTFDYKHTLSKTLPVGGC